MQVSAGNMKKFLVPDWTKNKQKQKSYIKINFFQFLFAFECKLSYRSLVLVDMQVYCLADTVDTHVNLYRLDDMWLVNITT